MKLIYFLTIGLVGGESLARVNNLSTQITMVAAVGWKMLKLQVVPGRVLVPQLLAAQRAAVPSLVLGQIHGAQFFQAFPWNKHIA